MGLSYSSWGQKNSGDLPIVSSFSLHLPNSEVLPPPEASVFRSPQRPTLLFRVWRQQMLRKWLPQANNIYATLLRWADRDEEDGYRP